MRVSAHGPLMALNERCCAHRGSWSRVRDAADLMRAPVFTSGQISDMLEIPPSTLRRYVKDFAAHLSETATKKRGRRFNERDVAVIARAREMLQQGRVPEEVDKILAVVGEEQEPEATTDSALALVPSISQALTEALDTARSLRMEVVDLGDQVDDVAGRQVASDRRLEQLEAWMREPWWRRLFGQPPDSD